MQKFDDREEAVGFAERMSGKADSIGRAYQDDSKRSSRRKAKEAAYAVDRGSKTLFFFCRTRTCSLDSFKKSGDAESSTLRRNAIDGCPCFLYFWSEIGAQSLLKRPDKGAANAGIVLMRDTVRHMSPSQVPYGRNELVERVQSINRHADHIH